MGLRPYTAAMVPRVLAAITAGFLAVLPSCTSYAPPELDVADVSVRGTTQEGMILDFTLDAENMNSEALPLRSVRYTLYLNGAPVFTGFRSPEATLRRYGTQQVTLPAVMALGPGKEAPRGHIDYRLEGTIEYITPGELAKLLYDSNIQRPTVSFEKAGTLDIATQGT